MRTRPLLAVTLAACLALTGGAAHAATKSRPKPKPKPPPCKTLTDAVGNTPQVDAGGTGGSLYDPDLDVVSADMVNNASVVTGVIRLAKLDQSDSKAPTGRVYQFSWAYQSDGTGGAMSARLTPTGVETYPTGARAIVDYAHAEVHITAQISALDGHPLFAKGDALIWRVKTDITSPATPSAPVDPVNGNPTITNNEMGQYASAPKPYPLYSPSCVTPGA